MFSLISKIIISCHGDIIELNYREKEGGGGLDSPDGKQRTKTTNEMRRSTVEVMPVADDIEMMTLGSCCASDCQLKTQRFSMATEGRRRHLRRLRRRRRRRHRHHPLLFIKRYRHLYAKGGS